MKTFMMFALCVLPITSFGASALQTQNDIENMQTAQTFTQTLLRVSLPPGNTAEALISRNPASTSQSWLCQIKVKEVPAIAVAPGGDPEQACYTATQRLIRFLRQSNK